MRIQMGNSKSRLMMLVVVAMLISILVACGQGNENNSSNKNNENKATDSANDAGKQEPKEKAKITVSTYDTGQIPPEEGTFEDNRWTKWINENGPVEVDFVSIPRQNSVEKFNTLFAAGDLPDLILEYDANFMHSLYEQKQLLPLDDLIEKSTEYKKMLEDHPILRQLGTKDDGKLYQIGVFSGALQAQHYMLIRKDWLDKLNLAVPTTTDELFEVVKAFSTMDPNGNKQADEFGISFSSAGSVMIQQMFGAIDWVLKDGELVKDFDRYQDAFDYMKRIYDGGYVDKDFLTDNGAKKAEQDWATGKLGIFLANVTSATNAKLHETLLTNQPEAVIVPIELPKSKYGQFAPLLVAPVNMTGGINAQADNPEAVMEYIDFIAKSETAHVLKDGLEGVNYDKIEGCAQNVTPEQQDLYQKQLRWTHNYWQMIHSKIDMIECDNRLGPNPTAASKSHFELKQQYEIYTNGKYDMAFYTIPKYMPQLPKELALTEKNLKTPIDDFYKKSIVTGSSYTAEKATTEAKALWAKGGGEKLEEWYKSWYQENKDSGIFANNIYDLVK
jgi:putative aldouronate transport system substrate-binding protein